ncbi:MAG: AIM24 family protein [Eubacteriales bacterium]
MLKFETLNELTLKVTCTGNDILYTKVGAFIAGENAGAKNYSFEKVMLGPDQGGGLAQAALGQLIRRVTGENIPLMKATFNGDSVTYYANAGQHVVVYELAAGETISIESENLLAFTSDCEYKVRFLGSGVISQKGLATSTLTGKGKNAFVAFLSDGNPLVLSNIENPRTLSGDPDAVICWIGDLSTCDPQIKTDISWKTFIGQTSGESYAYEWNPSQRVSVIIQPSERGGGIKLGID